MGETAYVIVNDILPTYSITAEKTSINEGENLDITIQTNKENSSRIYWELSGDLGVYTNDFATHMNSFPRRGSIYSWGLVDNMNWAGLQFTPVDDLSTEGDETLYFKLFSTSDYATTNQVGNTLTITIKDNEPSRTYSSNSYDYQFFNLGNNNFGIRHDNDSTIDSLTGIKTVRFKEKSLNIIDDVKETFDQVTGLNTDSGEMFRLYNAAFARFPDPNGLKYWIEEFSSGRNTRRVVSESFLNSYEFKQRYGDNISNEKYVATLYTNVLGRDYDQEGFYYWVGNLNSGLETRYELLLGFAESTENKALFTEMTNFG